ncbi:response regulator [Candidatus Saccharibacteria bacterium]|nr:response regulator [Candidatus Saccharibacteria bacterium]
MSTHNATILVVEDDAALNDAYTMILGTINQHNVLSAFDGREALEKIKKAGTDPDIILLDLNMPVMSGIEFLQEFKPANHPKCTVVIFSNYDAHKDIDEAYALGVERYVLKARLAPKDLSHLIKGILDEKEHERRAKLKF